QFSGSYEVLTKTATTFTYLMPVAPASNATGGTRQFYVASAFCRSGNFMTTCPQQAVNISTSTFNLASITRPGPIATGGAVTATATGTIAQLAYLNSGDQVTIYHTVALPIPATTSAPYYGTFTITKTSATTFTYTITAVGGTTPLSAAGNRTVVLTGAAFAPPPVHAAEFNRLAYNPAVNYQPPLKADGLPLVDAGFTDANGNYGSTATLWATATVRRDPYATYEATPMWAATTRDALGAKVLVPLYCNTDWPLLVNDPNYPAGPNGATMLDAGDANGQYLSGTGAWCRINGTAYDVSATSGAPAANADYNYPWQLTSGANNAKYFYRLLTAKSIHCDLTSPNRPRTGVIASCATGTPQYAGVAVAQRCVQGGNVCNPSAALRNYNPAACGTDDPLRYCAPGTGGSGSLTPGTGALPECLPCTCVADTANTGGNCRLDSTGTGGTGAGCAAPFTTGNASCPDIQPTITGCTGGTPVYAFDSLACGKFLFDPVANAPTTTTLLADANGTGDMCRHNNQTYAVGGAAGLFKYPGNWPGEGNGTGNFNQSINSGCPAVGTTVAIPRHYYTIAAVDFCAELNITANDQWRGFGTGGVCQEKNDFTKHKNVKYGQFTRHDLFAGNPQGYPDNGAGVARQWLAGASPGPDNSESINYANWYAYYSTRLLAGKTTSAIAFSFLTTPATEPIAYRVGFHNLGEEPSPYGGGTPNVWVNVDDWTLAHRGNWYNALFGISVSNFKTPTLDAMLRIGNLFETGGAAGVAAEVNPLPGSAADPISLDAGGNPVSCQNNYHILFTDGKTNQIGLPTTAGDQDETIPATLAAIAEVPPDQVLPNLKLGGAWLAPFKQGAPAVGNTLADVATYYWARDLRPTLKNDVPSSSGKVTTVGVTGQGDLDWTKDVAYWQHVNFNAISFGTEGVLDASNQPGVIADIVAATKTWPNLTQPNNPLYPLGSAAGAAAVDDLWRATVMSRGAFVNARSPIEVSYGLASILSGIQNQRKSRVGAAFSGQVLDANNNVIYEATIEPGWAGDLLKVQIDPATGAETTTWWNAATELKNQIDPILTGVAEPWMDEAHRRIVTLTGTIGPGVPFRRASISAAMQNSLANTVLQQEKLVSYLRGGNTYTNSVPVTTTIEGTNIGQFRKRFGALGDISNAQPAIVGPGKRTDQYGNLVQVRGYLESTDPGYPAFATTIETRSTRIIAPANDGMVHVFDAGPVNPAAAGGGTEVFAFIPRALFKGVAGNIATEDVTGIQALAYQDGGVPIYHHHMYVDSSPRVADVDFSGGAGTDWRTIVVGGLGKGGPSYYALDLTSPTAGDESAAAAKVLWEWDGKVSGVQEVRYSYGRPVIVKVRDSSYAMGRWVAIVTGGYNNVTGLGKLFFLDATNGALISTVTTSAGSAADPSGLAQIHAFVKNQNNQIAEQIYGGDLLGNLWRIDVSVSDSYKTATAELFATLSDGAAAQPVTTAPQIEIDINNGVDRYVFIGTGRLLDNSDLTVPTTPQTQTMYAIRDGTLGAFSTTGLPVTRADLQPINADGVSAIVGGAPNGWYHDLPNVVGDAERIVVDVVADVNIASYVGTKVQDDPCLISLPAKLYARDYTSARSLLLNSGGTTVAYLDFPQGAVGVTLVGRIQADGTQSLGALVSGEVPGTTPVDIRNPVTGPGSRLSWRLLAPE
ncbi:MAG: PilC/PilY family type IV pilus protein, partial [Betaproteobacteria bacterium]